MDVVDIDCIIMARPTKSTALYKQKLGRGQRIAPGKTDCLVLDMVGNNEEFGTDLDKLRVQYKRATDSKGRPISKECPQCGVDIHASCRYCPECDYEFTQAEMPEMDTPDMVDTEYGIQPPVTMIVDAMFVNQHISKKSGKELLQIRFELSQDDDDMPIFKTGSLWLCFPDDGYTGYAVQKGIQLWHELTNESECPKSSKEALDRENEILKPDEIVVDLSSKYPEIKQLIYDDIPF